MDKVWLVSQPGTHLGRSCADPHWPAFKLFLGLSSANRGSPSFSKLSEGTVPHQLPV